jgi:hypothetical protein
MKNLAVFMILLVLAACSQAPKEDVITELARKGGDWKLAGGDMFMDGGSGCLSFISTAGRIVHIFVLPDGRRKNGELVFEVRRDYGREGAILIEPNSEIEAQVLWLLQNYSERREMILGRDYAERMAYALKHRTADFPLRKKEEESTDK